MNPAIVYKYLPANRIDALPEIMLRATERNSLNDCFDLYPFVDAIDIHQSNLLATKNDLVGRFNPNGNSRITETEAANAIEPMLRDKDQMQIAADRIKSIVDKAIATFGVISMSVSNDVPLMWAHYADAHRGFVLGIDVRAFRPFAVDREQPVHTVEYSRDRMKLNSDLITAGDVSGVYFHKSEDWSYEKEVRVLIPLNHDLLRCKSGGGAMRLLPIPKQFVRSVIIGARMSGSDEKSLRSSLCPANGYEPVEFYRAVPSPSRFELDIVKIGVP